MMVPLWQTGNRRRTMKWSETMDERQEQKKKWVGLAIKLVLSLAALFPVYALLYLTFPASVLAFYLVSAVLFAVFTPWDELKKRFLS
jgi:hypothetical protein